MSFPEVLGRAASSSVLVDSGQQAVGVLLVDAVLAELRLALPVGVEVLGR